MYFHAVGFLSALTCLCLRFGSFRRNTSVHTIANEHFELYGNNIRNCKQHSANRGDDYYVTHGHSISR